MIKLSDTMRDALQALAENPSYWPPSRTSEALLRRGLISEDRSRCAQGGFASWTLTEAGHQVIGTESPAPVISDARENRDQGPAGVDSIESRGQYLARVGRTTAEMVRELMSEQDRVRVDAPLKITRLYGYGRPTDNRDSNAPLGWVMTLYRTEPSASRVAGSWDGKVVSRELDQAWFPTSRHAHDAANHIGWKLNGERMPGSSFGWTGKAGSPDGAWRYGIIPSDDSPWSGYACEWQAVEPNQYGATPIGPALAPESIFEEDHAESTTGPVTRASDPITARWYGQYLTMCRCDWEHLAEELKPGSDTRARVDSIARRSAD